jgi:hypothetical protein
MPAALEEKGEGIKKKEFVSFSPFSLRLYAFRN